MPTVTELLSEIRAKLEKEVAEIQSQVSNMSERQQKIEAAFDEAEKRFLERWTGGNTIAGLSDQVSKRKPRWTSVVRGLFFNEWGDGYEKEILAEYHRKLDKPMPRYQGEVRVMGTETDSAGGYNVPPEFMVDLIERLKAEAVVFQAGARLIPGVTASPLLWPKITGSATTYWVPENSEITASDLTTGQLRLEPKRLGSLVKLSQRLVRMAVPEADATIEQDMATEMALAIDLAALQGTGADGQPLGLANWSPAINTKAFGSANTYSLWLDLIGTCEDDNARVTDPTAGIIAHPADIRGLLVEQVDRGDGNLTGAYVYPPILNRSRLKETTGVNWFATTQLSSGTAYFGVWREMLIPQFFGMTLDMSTQAGDAFAKSQLWLKMETELDIGIRHEQSFAKGTGIA